MADETLNDSSIASSTSTESKAQEQARLRRERRNAKLQTGGSDRLNKILSSGGREAAAEAESLRAANVSAKSTPQVPRPIARDEDDPDEVDISTHFPSQSSDEALRAQQDMMRAMLRAPPPGAVPPEDLAQGPNATATPNVDDPMAQMMAQMQQMLGGAPGAGAEGLPGLASILQNFQQQAGQGQAAKPPDTLSTRLWTVIHAVFAFSLGVYALRTFTFTGSELARTTMTAEQGADRLFYIFVTVELVLQSTRFFMEGGRLPQTGVLAWAGRLLPEPYANYARTLSRYQIIFSTVVGDALVVMFVLGMVVWWKGVAAS